MKEDGVGAYDFYYVNNNRDIKVFSSELMCGDELTYFARRRVYYFQRVYPEHTFSIINFLIHSYNIGADRTQVYELFRKHITMEDVEAYCDTLKIRYIRNEDEQARYTVISNSKPLPVCATACCLFHALCNMYQVIQERKTNSN